MCDGGGTRATRQDGKGHQQAKAWMRREFFTCSADAPFAELEKRLIEERVSGRLYVVDEHGKVQGIVSRTDLLRHHNLYHSVHRRVA